MILGIDEAGRGPWAGPLVVGAAILGGVAIDGLTDSKKLTKKRREALYESITAEAIAYASGWVSAAELDELGMSAALRLATRRAVEQVTASYSEIIIDGTVNFLADTSKGPYVQTLAKADLLVPAVSAASIVAKVERDRYMTALDRVYPDYGFGRHAGYGVTRHREAIARHGVTPEHRLSFAPLAQYRTSSPVSAGESPTDLAGLPRTAKSIGDIAEGVVAAWLQRHGHMVLERNWRTKFCEIDIVSQKDDTVYFTEVKYRKSANQGGGLAAITPKKLQQMKFAAEFFALRYQLKDVNLRLAAAEVSGEDFTLESWMALL